MEIALHFKYSIFFKMTTLNCFTIHYIFNNGLQKEAFYIKYIYQMHQDI